MTNGYWDCTTARWEGREPEHLVPPGWDRSSPPPAEASAPAPPSPRESAEAGAAVRRVEA